MFIQNSIEKTSGKSLVNLPHHYNRSTFNKKRVCHHEVNTRKQVAYCIFYLTIFYTVVFFQKHVRNFQETRSCFFENMYVFYSNLHHNLYPSNYKPVINHFKQMLYCIFLIRLLCRLLQWHNRVNYSSTCT